MEKSYLVFWYDGTHNVATIVPLAHPPHEAPRGSILEELVVEALADAHGMPSADLLVNGVFELPSAAWSQGRSFEIAVGEGIVGSVECTVEGWRVHL